MSDPTALVTIDEALSHLGIDSDDDDALLLLPDFIDGLTSAVENHKHEVVVPRTVVERADLHGRRRFRLTEVPVMSLTSVETVDGATSWDTDAMDAAPNGLVTVLSGSAPTGYCLLTYRAGYAVIPGHYKRGGLIILQHVWETQRGTGSVMAGVIGDEESYNSAAENAIPRKALEWLGPPTPVVF